MFNEQNTVENFLRDRLARGEHGRPAWRYFQRHGLDRSEEDMLIDERGPRCAHPR